MVVRGVSFVAVRLMWALMLLSILQLLVPMLLVRIDVLMVVIWPILDVTLVLAPILLVLLPLVMIPLGIPMSVMVFGLRALIINCLRLAIVSPMLLALPGHFGMRIRSIRISVWILAQGLFVRGVHIVWTMVWCCVILSLLPGGFWIRSCT
jgi:hypothetical protein